MPSRKIVKLGGTIIWVDDNGDYHRLDGPAQICPETGYEGWFIHWWRHRLDGPAFIMPNNEESWWINGKEITTEVKQWMEEFEIRPWREWGDMEKIWFRIRFEE